MYLFAPLDHHYDKGFGAIADSFEDAATELKGKYNRAALNGHLPICYLFRHSIELFLKGSIILVHRGLKIPYGDESHCGEPKIPVKGHLKSLYCIHDIDLLYQYFHSVILEKKADIDNLTSSDWSLDERLSSKFKRLKDIDESSTYFRYPVDKRTCAFEKEKSAFKESTVEDVMVMAAKNTGPMKTMKINCLIGKDAQIFVHDDSFTEDVMNLLADMVEEVSTYHFFLMNTIGRGGLG